MPCIALLLNMALLHSLLQVLIHLLLEDGDTFSGACRDVLRHSPGVRELLLDRLGVQLCLFELCIHSFLLLH